MRNMRSFLLFGSLLLWGLPGFSGNESVVALCAYPRGAMELVRPVCTATAIANEGEDTIFLTAAHCFQDKDKLDYAVMQDGRFYFRATLEKILGNEDSDLALFRANVLLPPTALGKDPEVGSAFETLSWPMGFAPLDLAGRVSGYWRGKLLLQIVGVTQGSSGSPLFQHDRIVGIIVGTIEEVPGIHVAVPISRYTERERWPQ